MCSNWFQVSECFNIKNQSCISFTKRYIFNVRSSICEVLSVLDLKDALSLRLSASSKRFCWMLPYFSNASYLYQRMPMGLNISPVIYQWYINVSLDCLQSRKYGEAIMDDLLLFT